jgi:DNA-binding CsgD family transcriptional regulator
MPSARTASSDWSSSTTAPARGAPTAPDCRTSPTAWPSSTAAPRKGRSAADGFGCASSFPGPTASPPRRRSAKSSPRRGPDPHRPRPVAKGQRFLDPALVETALKAGANPLTEREADVLRAAAEGGTTTDIGHAPFPSPATVRKYLSNAISKLDARNRIDAIQIAQQSGWI